MLSITSLNWTRGGVAALEAWRTRLGLSAEEAVRHVERHAPTSRITGRTVAETPALAPAPQHMLRPSRCMRYGMRAMRAAGALAVSSAFLLYNCGLL